MSAFFTGLVSGFDQQRAAHEQEQFKQAQAAAAQEAEVYKTLLQSDRPEIQNMALAGLLESAKGPQKATGIRGWLGQMQQSPLYQKMQALIAQPDVRTETTLPSTQGIPPASAAIQPAAIQSGIPAITAPKVGAPAALPESNKVEAGQPSTPPPALTSVASPSQTTTTVGPPKPIFLSPEAKLIAGAKAKGLASGLELEGKADATYNAIRRAGGSHEEAQQAVKVMLGVIPKPKDPTAAALRDQFGGNVLGENITPAEWVQAGHAEPIDPQQTYRRMISAQGVSKFFPVDAQPSNVPHMTTLADPNTGQGYRVLVHPDGTWSPIGPVPATLRYLQRTFPDGTTDYLPVNPAARPMAPTAGMQGTAPPPVPTSAVAAPPPAPVAGGRVTTPPLTPNAGGPPARTASATAAPPAPGGTGTARPSATVPAGGDGRGVARSKKPVNYEKTAAARLGPSGEIELLQVNRNPRTNELTDQTTGQPVSGALVLAEPQAQAIAGQKLLTAQMADIKTKVKALLPSTSGMLGGHLAGPQTRLKLALDSTYKAQYAGLVAAVNEAAGQIRKIQGQSGAESERDYTRALTGLVELSSSITSGDTQEAVMARLASTEEALQTAQSRFVEQLKRAQTAAPADGGPLTPALEEQLRDLKPGFARRINGVEYGRHPDGTIFPTGK